MSTPPSLGAQVAWDGNRLAVTDPVAVQRVDRKAMSASTVKSMQGCPSRFVAEKLSERAHDPFGPAEEGTSAHTVHERLFTDRAHRRTKERMVSHLIDLADETWKPTQEIERTLWTRDVLAKIEPIFDIHDPTTVNVLAVEEQLSGLDINGIPFIGFIDLVEQLEDESIKIVDLKGLALDTPLPTPTGWTTMAQVQVGEALLGSDGKPTMVTAKSSVKHRDCYEVKFSDGTSVLCDDEHLWHVQAKLGRRAVTVPVTVLPILIDALGPESVLIRNSAPLDLPERDLPVDPYLLGAWLGDGYTKSGSICVGYPDLDSTLPLLAQVWDGELTVRHERTSAVVTFREPDPSRCRRGHNPSRRSAKGVCKECAAEQTRQYRGGRQASADWNTTLAPKLAALGVTRNKHVPDAYLRSSAEQRLALLQGLCDTDGSWHTKRQRVVFTSNVKAIADAVAELVASLGATFSRHEHSYQNPQRAAATSYMVSFRPTGFNPFRLPRKASLSAWCAEADPTSRRSYRAAHRSVTSVTKVASVPTQCVAVDAVDRLYLCGASMVPTHNTGKATTAADAKRWGRDAEGDQLRLYSRAYEIKHGVRPRYASLHYTSTGKARRVTVTRPQVNRAVAEFEGAWADLRTYVEQASFPTKVTPLCGWCPLVNACPAARKAGKEARIEAPEAKDLGIPTLRPEFIETGVDTGPPDVGEPPWHVADEPAHTDIEEAIRTVLEDEEHIMGTGWTRNEGKPWQANTTEDQLDPVASEAVAVIGLVSMAVEQLAQASIKVTPTTVKALSRTLNKVVLDAQETAFGHRDHSRGSNTRIRGALHAVLTTLPLPWGKGDEDWASWMAVATRRCVSIMSAALDLYFDAEDADDEAPYEALAMRSAA